MMYFIMMYFIILASIFLLIAIVIYLINSYNKRVVEELNSNPNGERAGKVMLITFPSGRSTPVNYLHEGNTIFAASDFNWWKSIEVEGTVLGLYIQGANLRGVARVSTDSEYTFEVFERLRPDAPQWASRMIGAKLVVIELE